MDAPEHRAPSQEPEVRTGAGTENQGLRGRASRLPESSLFAYFHEARLTHNERNCFLSGQKGQKKRQTQKEGQVGSILGVDVEGAEAGSGVPSGLRRALHRTLPRDLVSSGSSPGPRDAAS